MQKISDFPLAAGLAAAAVAFASPVAAIDLAGALGAGAKLGKAATLSDRDVIESANEACAYMDKKNKIASAGSKYAARLSKITQGLRNEDGLSLNFKVYETPQINAWAMANGCVRVYTGLLDKATDDEVRGVIGHEVGHVKLGHTKAKTKTALLAAGAREGVAASGNNKASTLAQSQLGGLAEAVVNSQFSQKEESAADEYGYRFMVKHKYDPQAMVSMFRKLPGSGGLTSTHPGSEARAQHIEKLIKEG